MNYRIVFALIGLLLATAAEVAGISWWLYQVDQGRPLVGFLALIAGEAIELSVLAGLVVANAREKPEQIERPVSLLAKLALIIFSESLLWVLWLTLIPQIGFVAALIVLLALMHLKHAAAIAVYAESSLSAELLSPWDIIATVLEVGGAAAFYHFFFANQAAVGIAILAVCISIEHSLQIVAASSSSKRAASAGDKRRPFS
ncbi:hypothetical protein [Mesorhizobium sp. M0408]|uniref:hypothetical protein n=1 Tax=Mesorhizobium sp. M0408 TaxID=2956942 RepID=UPI003334BF60